MIRLTPEFLKYSSTFLVALSVAVPTCLTGQQTVAATQSNEKVSVTKPVYDVATIRRGNWGLHGGALQTELRFTDDSFIAREMNLRSLVCVAYGVDSYQVSGGPDWVSDGHDGYDVTAKTTEDSTVETLRKMMRRQETLAQQQMLQALLADRFKLTVHHEIKQFPMSVLTVSKGGLKIQPTSIAVDANAPQDADHPPKDFMNLESVTDGLLVSAENYSMDRMADWLAGEMHHPVKNRTGLKGFYDFKLHYLPEYLVHDASVSSFPEASLTTALQEQLGLTVESRKGPVEIIVIDHAERPSEN